MGQYRKTLIQQRQTENHYRKLDKTLRAISKTIGTRKWVIEQELLQQLRAQGTSIDPAKLRKHLKTLNPHLTILGEQFYNLKKRLGKNWKTIQQLLDTAHTKNLQKPIIKIILALRHDPQTLLHVAKDLNTKLTNPNTDPHWWAKAWQNYTKNPHKAPALPSPDASYIQFNPPPRHNIKDGTPIQVHTPWHTTPILATAKKTGNTYRAHIKTQLQLLAQYTGKPYTQIQQEAKTTKPILHVTPANPNHIHFLAKAHTKGRINIPQPAAKLIQNHPTIYTIHTPTGKHTIIKTGTQRTRTKNNKTYTETYIQHKNLKPGTYHIEAQTPQEYLKNLAQPPVQLAGQEAHLYAIRTQPAEKISRYQFLLGEGIWQLGDVPIRTKIYGDISRNTIHFATQVLSSLKDEEFRITLDLDSGSLTGNIRQQNQVFHIINTQKFSSSYGEFYLITGERKAGKRVMRRKIVITREFLADQTHELYYKVLTGRDALIDKLSLTPRVENYSTIDLEKVLDTGDIAIIDLQEKDFWPELTYWKSLGNTSKLGYLGEKIAIALSDTFTNYIQEKLGLEQVSMEYTALSSNNIKPDFTFIHEENPEAFLEVSIGSDIARTLSYHLIPEAERRFIQENFKLGLILALEYSIEENSLALLVAEKERGKPWKNITKYIMENKV